MAEITASAVAKLREMTNAGMMDCKKALTEANGDLSGAVDILRKKGQATATTKGGREAKEGLIAQYIAPGGRLGVLIEVNSQTDFAPLPTISPNALPPIRKPILKPIA